MRGEIDLIALDGRTLVFVEVKALRATSLAGPERPAMAVGHRKRHKLRSLALAWLRDHDGSVPRTARFASTWSACASTPAAERSSGSTCARRSDDPSPTLVRLDVLYT